MVLARPTARRGLRGRAAEGEPSLLGLVAEDQHSSCCVQGAEAQRGCHREEQALDSFSWPCIIQWYRDNINLDYWCFVIFVPSARDSCIRRERRKWSKLPLLRPPNRPDKAESRVTKVYLVLSSLPTKKHVLFIRFSIRFASIIMFAVSRQAFGTLGRRAFSSSARLVRLSAALDPVGEQALKQ